jgi:hypothetical protein
MCGLCGAIGGDFHWSASLAQADTDPLEFRRQRRRRIALVSLLLQPCRLTVRDFQNRSLLLESPTGATEVVDDLAQLWQAVDRLLPDNPPDPLLGLPGRPLPSHGG